jgi:hypothetical protein
MEKLNLEMLKLIKEQKKEIDFLTKKLKYTNDYLLTTEIENYILVTCLQVIAEKHNISRQEKKEIILQAIEKIFPNIF